jgi:hypothetical protein
MELGEFESWNLLWHDYWGIGGFSGMITPKTPLPRHYSCHITRNHASIFF